MNIIGPDELVFGVDDLEACKQYLLDYGLKPSIASGRGMRFEALDGTGIAVSVYTPRQMVPERRPSQGSLK